MSQSEGPSQGKRPTIWEKIGDWVVFLAAVAVLAIGIWLAVGIVHRAPVAAAFTRVGGPTDVDTAVDASRFWLSAPARVVETPAHANSKIMLGAAACAAVRDAPLLFTRHGRRPPPVKRLFKSWRKSPSWAGGQLMIDSVAAARSCLSRKRQLDRIKGLSILDLAGQPPQLQWLPKRHWLAPFAVFAAPIGPQRLPDVAVGLALAAHLARADGKGVSLVYIRRYLEADPTLESRLEDQRAVVEGGVVLGQTPTVPEDTSALLRQLLTSVDRQGFLAQVGADLGSVQPVVAALLALFGITAATRKTPAIWPQVVAGGERIIGRLSRALRWLRQKGKLMMSRLRERLKRNSRQPTPKSERRRRRMSRDQLLEELKKGDNVTVWLNSGWKVTGKYEKRTKGALHLADPTLENSEEMRVTEYSDAHLPIEDILLVAVRHFAQQSGN